MRKTELRYPVNGAGAKANMQHMKWIPKFVDSDGNESHEEQGRKIEGPLRGLIAGVGAKAAGALSIPLHTELDSASRHFSTLI